MDSVLLEAKNLSLTHLWRGLSFKVCAGEISQITGANGSGKTSLIKVLCGLMRADKGRVLWQQSDIHQRAEDYLQEIVYVGHKDGIKADLTPSENLAFAGAAHNGSISDSAHSTCNDQDMDVVYALQQWQLTNISVPCRTLSTGQRRRTALARLLVVKARLWFLDEPLTSLDSAGRHILGEVIAAHLGTGGAVVMSTHQSPDWSLATQVLTLDATA